MHILHIVKLFVSLAKLFESVPLQYLSLDLLHNVLCLLNVLGYYVNFTLKVLNCFGVCFAVNLLYHLIYIVYLVEVGLYVFKKVRHFLLQS